ncbi:MAG: transporter [Thermoleophilia bacterium]|nr:transporter [Thermoleophilia bacterium]
MDRKWWTLLAVCTALFMLLVDITIVNVALPDIERDLDASFSDLQWVVDAYALSLAALLLTAGSLADLFGRKRIFATGLVLFTVASCACALSNEPLQLILSRAVQGIGGAMMFATSLAIVAATFRGKERGMALGFVGATTGLAVAVGPTVGGALTSGAGWEWIFLVNLPVGIIALTLTLWKVEESRDDRATRLDPGGLVTFSVALFALVLALIEGPEWGWGSGRVIGLLVASVLLLAAFVAIESRSKHPMFDLSLLRNRTFVGAGIVAFAISASIFAAFLYLVLWLQGVEGYDALGAGLRFLPLSGVSFFAAAISGRLTESVPKRLLLGIGMLLVAVAMGLMSLVGAGDSWLTLLPGLIVGGIGIGMVNPAIASTAVGVVDPRRAGMASGISSTFRQVGVATGIAGLGVVFRRQIEDGVVHRLHGTPAAGASHRIGEAVASGGQQQSPSGVPAPMQRMVEHAISGAVTDALSAVLMVGTVVALVGAVAAFLLVNERDMHVFDAPAARSGE